MKLLNTIIEQIIDYVSTSEFTDKLAGIGGGMTASILTFVNAGFADFAIKCFAAIVFAILGGVFGYLGKKLGEHIFNHYKKRKGNNK